MSPLCRGASAFRTGSAVAVAVADSACSGAISVSAVTIAARSCSAFFRASWMRLMVSSRGSKTEQHSTGANVPVIRQGFGAMLECRSPERQLAQVWRARLAQFHQVEIREPPLPPGGLAQGEGDLRTR